MNQRVLGIVTLVIVAILVIGGVLYVKLRPSPQLANASKAPTVGNAQRGKPAPNFVTASTQGEFNLEDEHRPVFLEFFATWCPHCQRETAVINRLYDNYRARVAFLGVPSSNTGMDGTSPESQLDVLDFQSTFKVEYPIAAYDPTLQIADEYLQGGFPTIAIVGKDKIVSYLNSGEVPYDELSGELQKVLR
jgi:cytochrome c biogenesis protein CcmG, thiol:disulfide interchange protein DsbE